MTNKKRRQQQAPAVASTAASSSPHVDSSSASSSPRVATARVGDSAAISSVSGASAPARRASSSVELSSRITAAASSRGGVDSAGSDAMASPPASGVPGGVARTARADSSSLSSRRNSSGDDADTLPAAGVMPTLRSQYSVESPADLSQSVPNQLPIAESSEAVASWRASATGLRSDSHHHTVRFNEDSDEDEAHGGITFHLPQPGSASASVPKPAGSSASAPSELALSVGASKRKSVELPMPDEKNDLYSRVVIDCGVALGKNLRSYSAHLDSFAVVTSIYYVSGQASSARLVALNDALAATPGLDPDEARAALFSPGGGESLLPDVYLASGYLHPDPARRADDALPLGGVYLSEASFLALQASVARAKLRAEAWRSLVFPIESPGAQPIPFCKYPWCPIDCRAKYPALGHEVSTMFHPLFGRVVWVFTAARDPSGTVLHAIEDVAQLLGGAATQARIQQHLDARVTAMPGVFRAQFFVNETPPLPPSEGAPARPARQWGQYYICAPAAVELAREMGLPVPVVAAPLQQNLSRAVSVPAIVAPVAVATPVAAVKAQPSPISPSDPVAPVRVSIADEGVDVAAAAVACDDSARACECTGFASLVWWTLVCLYAPFYLIGSLIGGLLCSLVLGCFYAVPIGASIVNAICCATWLGERIGTVLATAVMLLVVIPVSLVPALCGIVWLSLLSMPFAACAISLRVTASIVYHGSFGRCFRAQLAEMQTMARMVDEWAGDRPDGLGRHGFDNPDWMKSDVCQLGALACRRRGLQPPKPEGVVPPQVAPAVDC